MLRFLFLCVLVAQISGFGMRPLGMSRTLRVQSLKMVRLLSPENQGKEIFLYNTAARTKQAFEPIDQTSKKSVSFYSCGPTVYDFAHIGNFRAFLTYDVLKRWLTYCGYNVDHVCNLTDVDDKIIVKMTAEGKSLKEVTEFYSEAFMNDLDALNVIRANKYPKATEHINDIIAMISRLIETGHAYENNGSVYFRVSAFQDYGVMANLPEYEEMKEGYGGSGPNNKKGVEEKESARDFALWKAFSEADGEVVWDSPFGMGRPGWHIECSAMCNCFLGPTIDIHAGGVDLVFPHHQNEVAQSEAFSGKTFSNYWVHNGFVNIDNEKMSKSLKNFKTLREVAKNSFDTRAFRYMIVTAQYRSQLNFTPDTLSAAANSLKRIDKVVAKLEQLSSSNSSSSHSPEGLDDAALIAEAASCVSRFEQGMLDDINAPRAAAALFGLVGAAEKAIKAAAKLQDGGCLGSEPALVALKAVRRMDSVFGVLYSVPDAYFESTGAGVQANTVDKSVPLSFETVPEEVLGLANDRVKAKEAKDWTKADQLRAEIAEKGFAIKDVKGDAKYEIYAA